MKKFILVLICMAVLTCNVTWAAEKSEVVIMQENSSSDCEKISQLVTWERQSRVRHLYKELADCYFEDATVTTSWTKGSIADFLKGGNRAEATPDEIILSRVGVPIIHQNKNRAYVELPATTIRWIKVNGEEAVLTSYMRLLYRVERKNNIWRISDLTSINEDDTLEPAVPGTDLHLDVNDLKNLRHSYRYLAYTRIKAGGTVSNDLLGIDRPADIQKIYSETEAWLKNGL